MKYSYPDGSTPLPGYTIKQGVGVGGFGEVYHAVNSAGKDVALKRIQRNLDIELRGVRQCINLNHVNLISLWDIRTTPDDENWVVMEYVDGPNLAEILDVYPHGMPPDQVKRWFVSMASGVAYLHSMGIVHRDLKPANVFRDDDSGVIKIGDYGLSKFMAPSRSSGQTETVGSFHYMAPEIGRGVYGKEIDIYALGIVLFELLTGTVPFNGESTAEIVMRHLTDVPSLDAVPDEFRPAIERALQKAPEDRYHDVPAMLADLPWPEIAAESKNVVSHHSVGPLVGTVTAEVVRPTVESKREFDAPAGERQSASAEIQFGTLKEKTRPSPAPKIVAEKSRGIAAAKSTATDEVDTDSIRFLDEATQAKHPANAKKIKSPAELVANQSLADRALECLRSLLVGAFSCFTLNLLALAIGGSVLDTSLESWAIYGWLVTPSLVSVWLLLLAGRFWETHAVEASLRRLGLLGIGLVVGAVAFFSASGFQIDLADANLFGFDANTAESSGTASVPLLPAYLILFAVLFGTLRWWKQMDPARSKRLSILAVNLCFIWAMLLSFLLQIPAAPNCILAVVISVSIQLAAPWRKA